MKQVYVWRNDKLIPIEEAAPLDSKPVGLQFMPDIAAPFVSPIDGTVISSRAHLREHNRRNGVVDVGNDAAFRNPQKPKRSYQSAAPMLARLMGEG